MSQCRLKIPGLRFEGFKRITSVRSLQIGSKFYSRFDVRIEAQLQDFAKFLNWVQVRRGAIHLKYFRHYLVLCVQPYRCWYLA